MKEKKVVFMGTPDFAVPVLKELIDNTNVVLVVTQPDKKVGRHQEVEMTPVKKVALANNIPVFQPIKIREDFEEILNMKPDIIITCAYGQIIPNILLETPEYKAINVHASLLPKLRGGAPLHKSIIDGYKETGITIMYMIDKMDAGDIIEQEKIEITDEDNVGTIHDKLSTLGASLIIKTLPSIFNKTNKRIKQDENEVTYAYNIKREDERLDFSLTGKEITNKIRGLNPWPLANCILNDSECKILTAHFEPKEMKSEPGNIVEITKNTLGVSCKDGIIYLEKIKPFGKKEMLVKDYLNGMNTDNLKNKRVG